MQKCTVFYYDVLPSKNDDLLKYILARVKRVYYDNEAQTLRRSEVQF